MISTVSNCNFHPLLKKKSCIKCSSFYIFKCLGDSVYVHGPCMHVKQVFFFYSHKSMVVWIHKINLNDPDAIRDGNNNINPVRSITDVLMRASKTYKSFPAKK